VHVAALYDVHANLPSLEAVLADPRYAAADLVVCGGDLVAGPMPVECLDRLEAEGDRVRFLTGNGDREAVSPSTAPPSVTESAEWCAARLGDERIARIAQWPVTIELEVAGLGSVVFCHATPSSDTRIVTPLTPEEAVVTELDGVTADVVVCGHTHVQYDRRIGDVRLVNAGSVGMPYEGTSDAHWLLLGVDGVELVSTPYDAEAAYELLEGQDWPAFEWFARPLRGEVTAEEATAAFESRRGGA
jgi:predicted phosphodiesterase